MGVWLKGERKKIMMGSTCFLSEPTKIFSFQNGEKTQKRKLGALKRLEYPYASAHEFSFLYQFGFSFFSFFSPSDFYHLFFFFFKDKKIEFLLHKTKNYIKKIGGQRHVSSAIDIHTQTTKPLVGLNRDCKRKESKMKTVQN